MTWTYDRSTDLGKVRAKFGDVDSDAPILTDEEIEAHLDIHSDLSAAALRCAEEARAKLARDVDRSVLGVSSTRSQRITHLDAVIKGLRAEVSGHARIHAGGLLITDTTTSTTYKAPAFTTES